MSSGMKVSIGGKAVVMDHVRRVEYIESLDRLDLLLIELELNRNTDPKLTLSQFQVGKPFKLDLCEGDSVVWSTEGDLIEVSHERTSQGHRLLVLGVDGLHRLRGSPEPKLWEASHADIVRQIGQRHGLTVQADGVSTQAGHELQEDTDALFLRKLAREHNYYVRVLGKELHFKRWQPQGAAIQVSWGAELQEISVRAGLQDLVTKVTVQGYDALQDQAITGTASTTDAKNISGGDTGVALAKKLFGELPLSLNHQGYIAASNATARAKAELQRRAERFVQGRARLQGHPKARAGRPLKITGAGWPFDGTFLAREVRNILQPSGYHTAIDFVSDSLPSGP